MRKLIVLGVAVGVVVVTSAIALAAVPVTVSPADGPPKTNFTVKFAVDRELSSERWFTVEVVSAVKRNDCEYQEASAISYAPKGRRVAVVLRPVDKFRWCEGVYRGTIHVDHRIGCGQTGLDLGPCSERGPTVARFRFTVTP
jgi:hypothetical protein